MGASTPENGNLFLPRPLVGEARNADEAEKSIRDLTPDVVFLDIKMPGGSGFDLLSRLDRLPRVVFTTAYDEFAIRAFEVNALDYLLKPVEAARLATTLEKAAREMDRSE